MHDVEQRDSEPFIEQAEAFVARGWRVLRYVWIGVQAAIQLSILAVVIWVALWVAKLAGSLGDLLGRVPWPF